MTRTAYIRKTAGHWYTSPNAERWYHSQATSRKAAEDHAKVLWNASTVEVRS